MHLYLLNLSPSRGHLILPALVLALAQSCGEPFTSCDDSHTCESGGSAGASASSDSGGSGGESGESGESSDSTSTSTSGMSEGSDDSVSSPPSSSTGSTGSGDIDSSDTGAVCSWDECFWDSGAVFVE